MRVSRGGVQGECDFKFYGFQRTFLSRNYYGSSGLPKLHNVAIFRKSAGKRSGGGPVKGPLWSFLLTGQKKMTPFCWQNKVWMVSTWGGWTRLEGHASRERVRVFRKIERRTRLPGISKQKQRMKPGPTGRGYDAIEYTNKTSSIMPKAFTD